MSLFDLLEKETLTQKQENVCENRSEEDEEPTETELCEAANCDEEPTEEGYEAADCNAPANEVKPVQVPAVETLGSPFYQRYKKTQEKYPDPIVAFRRGDFYKILGSNAELFAKEFSLTPNLSTAASSQTSRMQIQRLPALQRQRYHLLSSHLRKIPADKVFAQTRIGRLCQKPFPAQKVRKR